jgi:hypothetical protein
VADIKNLHPEIKKHLTLSTLVNQVGKLLVASTCYGDDTAWRPGLDLREMSGVQLRHQYVLCNTKKNKRFE